MLSSFKPKLQNMLFPRGESAIAGTGLAITVIFVIALGGCVGWAIHTQRVHHAQLRRQCLERVGGTLAEGLSALLAQGKVTAARQMVRRTATVNGWAECRVETSNGVVIADADVSVRLSDPPDGPWPKNNAAAPAAAASDRPDLLTLPLDVPGRGTGRLQIADNRSNESALSIDDQIALGVICVLGLGGLWLTYRMTRLRMRGVSAIHECLEAVERGEQDPQALKISVDLGAIATAWNNLLEENTRLKRDCKLQQVRSAAPSRPEASTDLDVACDALSQGMILVSNQMKMDYINGAASIFLGHDRKEMLHAPFDQFIDNAELVQAVNDLVNNKTTRRSIVEQMQGQTPSEGVLRFIARPVRQQDHSAAMVVIEDITQQRIADASRHTFVAHATHELRTPLTNIRAYVETAIEDGSGDSRLVMNSLNVVNEEVRRLEQIVSDLLSVTEIEAGSHALRRDDVALSTLLTKLEDDFREQAHKRNIKLTFTLPPKLPVIYGDQEKVMLALTNLVGNALKYTPEGGSVRVEVTADESSVQVNVIDTGFGISESDQARIFEKFYRSEDPQVAKITGTGLGLALAREVIRLHGGDITVDSEHGKGSTFTLTLPVTTKVSSNG